jgi:flagellar biosynthesis/type III secretory pathway chaperone
MKELGSYIEILKDSLQKKISVLQALLEATNRQSSYIDGEEFSLDVLQEAIDQKDVLLEQLDELDQGFDRVFQEIRSEFVAKQAQYRTDIAEMQKQIRLCTDIGVEIQRIEEQNKNKLLVKFADQKKELRKIKTSSKVASTYYKNMSKRNGMSNYFVDQKK